LAATSRWLTAEVPTTAAAATMLKMKAMRVMVKYILKVLEVQKIVCA